MKERHNKLELFYFPFISHAYISNKFAPAVGQRDHVAQLLFHAKAGSIETHRVLSATVRA